MPAFNPHKISFSKLCDDFIPVGGAGVDLPYAINIYVYGFFVQPHANAVGSNAYYLTSTGTFNTTLIHEMGHCLYLFHTHNEFGCLERPDGSNCVSCGDYVCDTPADPSLYTNKYWVNSVCEYNGTFLLDGQAYNPDTHNFMSYSTDQCRNRFSVGQGQRMYSALKSLSLLIPVTKAPEIQGQNSVCSSSPFSFTVLPNTTVSWSTNTSGLSIDATGLATRVNNYNGYATIAATIINGNSCGVASTLTKNILVGTPLADNSMELVFTMRTSEISIDIPVSHLPDGNYFLNILDGKELTKKQIIVKH